MKRRGVETRLVFAASNEPPRKVDPALLKALARARVWFSTNWASGRVRSLAAVARNEGIAKRYVERLARLAFVAPAIVEVICQGQQSAELTTQTLLNRIDLSLEWTQQEYALGIK
jgi:site-specific DNA recombinase